MSDSAFREPGKKVSRTLEALAKVGEDQRLELPRDAEKLERDEATSLLDKAFDVDLNNAGCWVALAIAAWALGISTCSALAPRSPGAAALSVILPGVLTFLAFWIAGKRARERAASVAEGLARVGELPFPVEGYREWILSERPLFDLTLAVPVDEKLQDAVRAIDSSIEVELLDDRTARFSIPARKVERGETVYWFGDAKAFADLAEKLLVPLHEEVGIDAVRMGGYRNRT